MSIDVYNKAMDFGLYDMCSKPERGFKGISVFPQIVADHKGAGWGIKYTDIRPRGTETHAKGYLYNVVHSSRLNADALIDGSLKDVVSQWPEDTPVLTGPVVTEFRDEPTNNTPDATDGEE